MTKLYVYIMTDDKGVAPNPYGGKLTLTLCKSIIRKSAEAGDIIVGIIGKGLSSAINKKAEKSIENLSLCYIARIDKKLSIIDYDNLCKDEHELQVKTPKFYITDSKDFSKDNLEQSENIEGDNIYDITTQSLRHYAHSVLGLADEIKLDMDAPYMLFCEDFCYLGKAAISPEKIKVFEDSSIGKSYDKIMESFSKAQIGHRVFESEFNVDEFYDGIHKLITKTYNQPSQGKIDDPSENLRDRIIEEKKAPLTFLNLTQLTPTQQTIMDIFKYITSRKKSKRSRSVPTKKPEDMQQQVEVLDKKKVLCSEDLITDLERRVEHTQELPGIGTLNTNPKSESSVKVPKPSSF